jgi:hypothetical protein
MQLWRRITTGALVCAHRKGELISMSDIQFDGRVAIITGAASAARTWS